ncbi:50S ribosomal protein L11 methyltransferase [Mucilaginibacter sp. Bleaf8]|uniref:50S ribosomal protein L11 methyltransferase n=1 Tax=Mucilaginibacter sp. Bleaf8 TaxID=2834430 RepID=UPI001BD1134E|nr:50S ribosomal protein L11 methyltransferase [Mucilaginibacter sp. Bleaf8]MBS7563442.1 50S ribosomal protein L11 methyltransferase [Mucilaginibacter sp. Bleaf8]
MNYYELLFTVVSDQDYQQDLLINELSGLGFDTFEETDFGFKAYIPSNDFDRDVVEDALALYHEQFNFSYEINLIPEKNWNEVWESNFQPITIGTQVYVRATFHEPKPEFPYEIVIDPKMAFGTGHHDTTSQMMQTMLEHDWKGKKVLDMGCGTGILAILAAKLGATDLTAIDYDMLCYKSTIENTELNHVPGVQTICGSKEDIPDEQYDVILANINRNILLDQMARYGEVLKPGGEIYFSGFYESPDLDIIREEAAKHGMVYNSHKTNNNWVAARFVKQ